MAGIIFYIIAAVRYIVDEYDKSVNIPNGTALQYLGGAGSLYIVLTLIVAGVHALWLPMLVLLHIYFAAIGKTSAEYIVGRAHRHHHRKDG